jgi:predicted DNA-binding antitoxin AbrB/MazE fold protein
VIIRKKKPSKQVAQREGEAVIVNIRIPKRLKKYNVEWKLQNKSY